MTIASAFRELRRTLIARQNFTCCQSCGVAEIVNLNESKPGSRGYCFYHKQDADNLKERGCVYLAFGSLSAGVDSQEIGREIVEVFQRHGCPVDWNDSSKTRPLVWRDENARRKAALGRLGGKVGEDTDG